MFKIGIIVKPQGIRGEVRVYPTTDDPSRFALLEEVFAKQGSNRSCKNAVSAQAELIKYTLLSSRVQGGVVVLSLEGVSDRSAAEKLVGSELYIPDEWALELEEDEYFVRDLIGCTAVDEDGAMLGEISDVFPTGANDVYMIKPLGKNITTPFMVPAIKDVVRKVDIPRRRVTLRLFEGLLGLRA